MQIRQRGKDGKASKQPGISRNTQPDRRSKEGTERTSSIWEGCRANPRAVSMAVLDTGRPLYLCMGKSNRRESGGNEIRERRRYDSGVKGEEAGLYKKAGTLAKKGGRSVETAYRESPLELLLSERAYRLLYKMVMGILAFSVRLCLLQNVIDAGISAKTAVIYLLAVERYPLQVTAAYSVTATVSDKIEHDTVAVRQSQFRIVYLGFGLFGRQTGIEITRSQHDLSGETHGFCPIFFHGRSHGAFVPTVSDKRCGQASVPVRQFEHADLFLHHGQADSFVLLFRHFDETCAMQGRKLKC